VSGETGHAAQSNKPPVIAIKRFVNRLNRVVLVKIISYSHSGVETRKNFVKC
jgi:hypothetical protein